MARRNLPRLIKSIKFCEYSSAAEYSTKLNTNASFSHKLPFLLSQASNPHLKNKIAFTDYNGNNSTFGELAAKSAGLAEELNRLVPGSEQERIAFLCDRDFSFLVTLASIWWTQHVGRVEFKGLQNIFQILENKIFTAYLQLYLCPPHIPTTCWNIF